MAETWRSVAGRRAIVGLALLGVALISPDGGVGGDAAAEAGTRRVEPEDGGRGAATERSDARQAVAPDPRRGLDLGAFVEEGGRLVQHVEDRTIVTTLDPELQAFAEALLERYAVPDGAAVALNSRTGEVLVLAQHSERSPGRAVALAADAPAASMFKVVTAAALLDLTDLGPGSELCYHGGLRSITEDLLVVDPTLDRQCATLASAMGRSINVIFARLADQRLTSADLDGYVTRFGFGRPIPFDLPVELSLAEVPEERLERARMAAGFWHTHVSPLHAAMIAQAIAQDGALLRPYLVDEVRDGSGEVIYDGQPVFLERVCAPETAGELADMMVVTTTSGTARSSFLAASGEPVIPGVEVAGKTGTLHGRNPFRAYDWFLGFAPADDPEIAVAGLVVNDPQWRIKGHYVAREILRQYFLRERQAGSPAGDGSDAAQAEGPSSAAP